MRRADLRFRAVGQVPLWRMPQTSTEDVGRTGNSATAPPAPGVAPRLTEKQMSNTNMRQGRAGVS